MLCFLCFVTFPRGVLGQMWYLIISIPALLLAQNKDCPQNYTEVNKKPHHLEVLMNISWTEQTKVMNVSAL